MNKKLMYVGGAVVLILLLSNLNLGSSDKKDANYIAGTWNQLTSKFSQTKVQQSLCHKTAESGWACIKDNMKGAIVFTPVQSETFTASYMVQGLQPNTEYQIKFNSVGVGSYGAAGGAHESDVFANACPGAKTINGALQCGKWGDEGFVVIKTIKTNSNGGYGFDSLSLNLPPGMYESKVLFAMNQAPWTTPLMEQDVIRFIVMP